MRRFAFTILFSFLAICGYAQTPDDFSFRKTYSINTPGEMSISTSDGFIEVNAHTSNNIEVFFIVTRNNKVLDIDLEDLDEQLDVEIESSGDRLEISIRHRESSWLKNWKDRYNVSFHINAPSRIACNLKTSDGDISLIGFQGEQYLKTSDGDIEAEDIIGNLTARTSDGDVSVLKVEGSITLNSSDGDIMAVNIQGNTKIATSDGNVILESINGDSHVKTSDGNIVFEHIRGSLTAQTSDGDIRGDLAQLIDELYLKTSDGNISVTVPEGLGMNIRLKGEDIDTRLEDFSGKTSDHLIEGTIRGGGIDVELTTSDGDIRLNYN